MALGQSDRQSLFIKPEAAAAYGVVVSTGNFNGLRFNSESLKFDLPTAKSMEIVARRGVRDLIIVDASAAGSIATEVSYGEYDALIEAALATTVQNVIGTNGVFTGGTGTFSATGLTITGGSPFTNAASGQWLRVTGAVNTGNNTMAQILSVLGATGVTVASGAFFAETGTTGLTLMGRRYINGATKRSYSIERFNAELGAAGTGMFECFRGMVVNGWNQDLSPGSIISQSFDFVGRDALPMNTAKALPGTGIASYTNRIMNSVNNISNITEGGAALSQTFAKSIGLKVMNNVDGLDALGALGNVDFRLGEFNAQLQLSLYLGDATYYNKFINNTVSSFSYRMTDSAGNAYVVSIPNARYTTGDRPNPGRNQALMLSLGIEALEDATTGAVIIIDACGAAVVPLV